MLDEDDNTGLVKTDSEEAQNILVPLKSMKNSSNLITRMLKGLDLNNVIGNSKLRNLNFKQNPEAIIEPTALKLGKT